MCLNSSWDPVKHQCEPLNWPGYVLNICWSMPLHGIGFTTGLLCWASSGCTHHVLRTVSPLPSPAFIPISALYVWQFLPACNLACLLTHPQATFATLPGLSAPSGLHPSSNPLFWSIATRLFPPHPSSNQQSCEPRLAEKCLLCDIVNQVHGDCFTL